LKSGFGSFSKIQIIILGNKIDLNAKREVQFEEADKFCQEHKVPLFETSAKEDINVKKSIIFLAEKIYNDLPSLDNLLQRNSFNLRESQKTFKTEKEKCCFK
jgi:GTPase SAR1 family protein